MRYLKQFGRYLEMRQRWVLIALLGGLHLTILAGADQPVGLMCWLVDVGFFLLWQPFVEAERRVDRSTLLLLVLALAIGAWLFGWWLLILWVVVLAALLGGRVMMLGHRPTRIFYLLAFAYLLGVLLVWLVPKVVPNPALIGPSLEGPFARLTPLIFVVMLLIPTAPAVQTPTRGVVDFFYSLFIFLLISVLILGSLAFMQLSGAQYIEAVFKALISMAAMLLIIALAWDPRPGFSGVGVIVSRYLLTIGLPFETWLQRLMDCAAQENDPERFLQVAFAGMSKLPWIVGGAWVPAEGARGGSGQFGAESEFRLDFSGEPLVFSLFTRHKLSPALVWHFHLLLQLTNEYYAAKQHARELQRMSYLQAVHETGARLTHDVKNLLQSLNNLCYAAQQPLPAPGDDRLSLLLSRQLPQITQRLRQTLDKLQQPEITLVSSGSARVGDTLAEAWWRTIQQRYAHEPVVFAEMVFAANSRVPSALFDGVADNLVQNALLKRQADEHVAIRVSLSSDARNLRVHDNGACVPESVARDLFAVPVSSENGLGIGLYHAARQAEAFGFVLKLIGNANGDVCFELRRAESDR